MYKYAAFLLLFSFIIASCSKKAEVKDILLVHNSLKSVTVLAGSTPGYADGNGTGALFNHPTAAVFDSNGNLLVVDENNNRIRKITPVGAVSTFAGNGVQADADGPATEASFNNPISMAADRTGNIYVLDGGSPGGGFNIRKISAAGDVSTLPVIITGSR
jgi:hypothetical protein